MMQLNEEDEQKLVNTIDFGLVQDMVSMIVAYSIKTNKVKVVEELRLVMDHFFSSLNQEETVEFKKIVETVINPKLLAFKQELDKSYTPEEVQFILTEVQKSSRFLKHVS